MRRIKHLNICLVRAAASRVRTASDKQQLDATDYSPEIPSYDHQCDQLPPVSSCSRRLESSSSSTGKLFALVASAGRKPSSEQRQTREMPAIWSRLVMVVDRSLAIFGLDLVFLVLSSSFV